MKTLLTIYKSFVRPHLDYGDILYYQPYNESMNSKLESIQYNATLATYYWGYKRNFYVKIRPLLVESSVMVIFYVIFLMCYAVIIN